jgi:hypothetical protein
VWEWLSSGRFPLPEPSHFDVEIATKKLKRYKSPLSADRIPAEMISKQEVIRYILRSINLLTLSGIRINCHRNVWTLMYLFTKKG